MKNITQLSSCRSRCRQHEGAEAGCPRCVAKTEGIEQACDVMKTYNVTDITNITRGTVLDMSMERDTARRECHAGKESWEAAGVDAAEGRAGGGEKEEITH